MQTPKGGSLTFALIHDRGRLRATVTAAELARPVARDCGDHPTGADDGNCACPGAGPPADTAALEPTDK